MEVTAESNQQFLAFRRLIYSLSKKLKKEEAQAIVYIHFYNQKDQYKSCTPLEIFCKLESNGIITASHPEKLLELMKDLKRQDLVNEVKDFFKKRKKSPEKKANKPDSGRVHDESEDDLVLRATLEAAFVQATVLLQQMERLQIATSGITIQRDRIMQLITEAAQTSEALAERLRRAEVKANPERESFHLSSGSDQGATGSGRLGYINSSRSDYYSAMMSASVPTNLVHFYKGSGQAALPETTQTLQKLREGDIAEEDDDEEDDYEHMKPGVTADVQSWQESRVNPPTESNDYSTPRLFLKKKQNVAPVKYSTVVLPLGPEDYFTPRLHKDKQAGPGDRTREEGVVPKRWTKIPQEPTEECAAAETTSSDMKVASHMWAKPQNTENYIKPALSLQLSTPTPVAIPRKKPPSKLDKLSQSVSVKRSSQHPAMDDNYTTLHPTKDTDDLNFYKPLDRTNMDAPDVYTAVQYTDPGSQH